MIPCHTRVPLARLAVVTTAFVVPLGACAATIPEPAMATRAAEAERCANLRTGERLRCYRTMAPLREDEPQSGACVAHVDGERWATEAAPRCLDRDRQRARNERCGEADRDRAARENAKVSAWVHELAHETGSERRGAREALERWLTDAAEARSKRRAACESELASLAGAEACLRDWRPGYANVHGLGRTCFVEVELARLEVLARRKSWDALDTAEDTLVATARGALADADATDKEEQRKREASRRSDAAVARCAEAWSERDAGCAAPALDAGEQARCHERCRAAMAEAVARATQRSLEECVDSFVAKPTPDVSCALRRPTTSTLGTDELDLKQRACSVECRRRGPDALARSRAEAVREAAERRREEAEARARPKRPSASAPVPSPSCGAPWYPHQGGSGAGAFTLMCDGPNGGSCVYARLGSGSFTEATIQRAAAACCCVVR